MENTSKALIIAGSVLLAILLISFGIMVFNQAQDTSELNDMDQVEITSFNSKFIKYEGEQKGTDVKSLINEIIAVNGDGDDNNDIEVTGGITDGKTTRGISSNATYIVTLSYEGQGGRISSISIQ